MSGTKPTPGVTITLTGDASDSVVTDANGEFSFDLPDGSYVLTPSLAGHQFSPASTNVEVSGADDTDNDFTAEGVYTISGTVTGDEVEGVTITLTGDASDSTTTAADGTYSFSGLVDGSYNVEPSLEGYTFTPTDTDVTISGADDTDTDFVSASAYIALPQTFLYSSATDDYMGNTAKYVRYADSLNIGNDENVSNPGLVSVNAGTYTGCWRCARMLSNHQYTSLYAGTSPLAINEGGTKRFDLANGLRVLWMVGNEGGGSSAREIDHLVGFTCLAHGRSSEPTHGWPNTYVRGRLYGADANPARFYIDHKLQDGANVNLLQVNITGVDLRDSQHWCAVGFEIPPNGSGNLTVHAKIYGDNVAGPHSASVACPDLTGYNLDAPFHVGRGFGAPPTASYGFIYENACWVGTASDAWPWGGF